MSKVYKLAMYINIEEKLDGFVPRLKRFKSIIVIRILDETAENNLSELEAEVKKFFSGDIIFRVEDCICTLISSSEIMLSGYNFPQIEEFDEMLQKYGAYAMLSNSSQWAKGLNILFNETYQCMPIAKAVRYKDQENKRVLVYNRYLYYYSIYLAEQSMRKNLGTDDILYLCDASILTLTRYDRAFNSDLRDFLFTFLMCDRNISETSRQLYVHRNTVIYKLNRVKDLIGTDWVENPYTRHGLLSSCMLLRYVEKYRGQYIELPPIEKVLLKKKNY